MRRVDETRLDGCPNEPLTVIDATTGQNGLRQAQAFAQSVERTGVVLTKLDGAAKGGIALAIASEVIATVALKASDGFSRPLPAAIVVVGYGLSFWLLALVLKHLSVGTTYAVWSVSSPCQTRSIRVRSSSAPRIRMA